MKKICIFFAVGFLLWAVMSHAVNAADVGVIVKLADGTLHSECVNIRTGSSGYDVLEKTSLNIGWQNYGFGYFLESIEGVPSDPQHGYYWSLWNVNNSWNDFESSMVGAGDYKVSEKDMIGVSYTQFDSSFNPITKPPFSEYISLCPERLKITRIRGYVDGEKKTLEDGDTIRNIKPGASLKFIVEVENLDEGIDEVKLEAAIYDVDDEGDLEESDSVRIEKDDKKELEVEFRIPSDAVDDKYDVSLLLTTYGGIIYENEINLKASVEREEHSVIMTVPSAMSAECKSTVRFKPTFSNNGQEDETVTLKVTNEELGIGAADSFQIKSEATQTRYIELKIPSAKKGDYDLRVMADYSGKEESKTVLLSIDCVEEPTLPKVNGVSDKQTKTTPRTVKSTNTQTPWNIILLIAGNLLLVLFMIYLIKK